MPHNDGQAIDDLEFGIVVPKKSNGGRSIKSGEIKEIAEDMSAKFGGTTITPSVLGCWNSEDKGLICEENAVLSSALNTEDSDAPSREEAQRFVESKAEEVADEFGQAAVMTSENRTEVEFVGGEYQEEIDSSKTGESPFDKHI